MKCAYILLVVLTLISCNQKSFDFSNTDAENILAITQKDLEKASAQRLVTYTSQILVEYDPNTEIEVEVLEKCLEIIDVAIRKNRYNDFAYGNKLKALFKLGRYEDAITTINQMIQYCGDFPELYMNKGAIYEVHGVVDSAAQSYGKAIDLYNEEISRNKEDINLLGAKTFAILLADGQDTALLYIDNLIKQYPEEQYLFNVKSLIIENNREVFLSSMTEG